MPDSPKACSRRQRTSLCRRQRSWAIIALQHAALRADKLALASVLKGAERRLRERERVEGGAADRHPSYPPPDHAAGLLSQELLGGGFGGYADDRQGSRPVG